MFEYNRKRNKAEKGVNKKDNEGKFLKDNRTIPVTQQKKNNTGLPDQLKSGVESLSGYSMDDVKVHYNSSKPAQLNAHAFAQGTNIHLASGQEKHLPHEAWHVVQQKQGRVKPTKQLKSKVDINDDTGLEREADVMGAKANSASTQRLQKKSNSLTQLKGLFNTSIVIQRAKRERKRKERLRKQEIHGRRQRFKKDFLDSKSPLVLKKDLEQRYKGDALAEANIKNAWRDALLKNFPVIGKNVIITDPTASQSFTELMKSTKFQDTVMTVLLMLKKIFIRVDNRHTQWSMSAKTIFLQQVLGASKESYMRGIVFEMNNALRNEEFEDHNKKMATVVGSKHNQGRSRIRFALNATAFANAMEDTEWESTKASREIGQEGVDKFGWNKGQMVDYYKANKGEHMKVQKNYIIPGYGFSHYGRYIKESRRIQNRIRDRMALKYSPDRLRKRFQNDRKLRQKYGGGAVDLAVQQAITAKKLTDEEVMRILRGG